MDLATDSFVITGAIDAIRNRGGPLGRHTCCEVHGYSYHTSMRSLELKGYDTFGNLVRLPRNQGKSQQKSLEIKKSGFTSEITSCHQILFEIHVKSSLHIKYM